MTPTPSTTAAAPLSPAAATPGTGAPSAAERRAARLPYAGLGVVLLLWGLGPPLSKLITIAPLTASFTRLWTSSIGIVAVQTAMGSRPTRKALRGGMWGGLAFGVNSIAFFYAIANASIATVTVISALQPALVMIGASRIFGEKVTRWGLGWTAVAIGGAAVAVLGKGAAVHTTTLGIVCSVGSLLCMTVYFLASKQARQTLSAGEYVMGVMLWASVVVTPVAAIGGGLGHLDELDRFDWLWIMVMLIGPGVGGQLLMGWAVRFVPVSRTAMILLGSTVVSILAAWPIHGERPELIQLLGCGITLAAVTLILQRR